MKRKSFILLSIFVLSVTTLFSSPPDWVPISGTQYSMILMARITYNGSYFEGEANQNVAAAFGPNGESDCRSLALWQPPNPPHWMNGYWYFTIVGNDNGETISFKIYNEDTDSIYNCLETITFENDTTIGDPYVPFILSSLFAPTDVTVTVDSYTGIPTISWATVDGAVSYYIYSGDSPNVDTTTGTHVAQVSDTTWSDIAGSKKFYVLTSSGDSLSTFQINDNSQKITK